MAMLDDGTLTVTDWLEAAGTWGENDLCEQIIYGLSLWRGQFANDLELDVADGDLAQAEESFDGLFELSGLLALAGVE